MHAGRVHNGACEEHMIDVILCDAMMQGYAEHIFSLTSEVREAWLAQSRPGVVPY